MDIALFVLVVFFACFTQSLVGFGTAMVGMPLLVGLVGIRIASPLVAMLGLTVEVILVVRYRNKLDLRVVWKLIAAAIVGIPLGVMMLKRIDEDIVLTILGVVIVAYALYGLSKLRLPRLDGAAWPYLVGFASGVLGGAYNTSGPPVVIYGNCRRWTPSEFLGNLQSFFLAVDLVVVATHAASGNLSPDVWRAYALALIPLAVGLVAGSLLAGRVNQAVYGKLVLVMLIVLGLRLIL
jgi:hypothetical protein